MDDYVIVHIFLEETKNVNRHWKFLKLSDFEYSKFLTSFLKVREHFKIGFLSLANV